MTFYDLHVFRMVGQLGSTILKKLLQKLLCRSQFLEHKRHCLPAGLLPAMLDPARYLMLSNNYDLEMQLVLEVRA